MNKECQYHLQHGVSTDYQIETDSAPIMGNVSGPENLESLAKCTKLSSNISKYQLVAYIH